MTKDIVEKKYYFHVKRKQTALVQSFSNWEALAEKTANLCDLNDFCLTVSHSCHALSGYDD